MSLRRYYRALSVSVSDSVSEDKCKETNSSGAQSQLGILRILPESKNIPAVRMLVADKVAGAVNKIKVEV